VNFPNLLLHLIFEITIFLFYFLQTTYPIGLRVPVPEVKRWIHKRSRSSEQEFSTQLIIPKKNYMLWYSTAPFSSSKCSRVFTDKEHRSCECGFGSKCHADETPLWTGIGARELPGLEQVRIYRPGVLKKREVIIIALLASKFYFELCDLLTFS
jgi:hypothetical protein